MVTAAMKLRRLLFGRKVMTNLDSTFKSRDITLPTKVCLDKDLPAHRINITANAGRSKKELQLWLKSYLLEAAHYIN